MEFVIRRDSERDALGINLYLNSAGGDMRQVRSFAVIFIQSEDYFANQTRSIGVKQIMSILNSPQKVKKLVLTGAVTAVTIAGTLYGAGLKTQQEVSQQTQKAREITLDERIASLQSTRQVLIGKKELVEKQMRDLDARIEERKQKGIDNKRV
ncbi:uncharacterized protein BDW70DRAFT_162412 [Aspergillus foveolatus]|uniref:uncharacterized protein n=1 Tax=Aspergillus foveolatus TaxID=210207 RepID=UPI003CCCB58F